MKACEDCIVFQWKVLSEPRCFLGHKLPTLHELKHEEADFPGSCPDKAALDAKIEHPELVLYALPPLPSDDSVMRYEYRPAQVLLYKGKE